HDDAERDQEDRRDEQHLVRLQLSGHLLRHVRPSAGSPRGAAFQAVQAQGARFSGRTYSSISFLPKRPLERITIRRERSAVISRRRAEASASQAGAAWVPSSQSSTATTG